MVRKFASIAVAGALMMVAAPVFAQDLDLNPLGLPVVPHHLGDLPVIGGGAIDLDPLHIFTPAAAPAAAGPAMHRHHHHHMMMRHKKMMMHHKKMMMHHKAMMKKAK